MTKQELIKAVTSTFPQFREKSSLLDYYCNYEIPLKQTSLLKLWTEVLKFDNHFTHTLLLSQQELLDTFEIYGLKPLPIPNILKALATDNKLYSLSDLQRVYGEVKEEPQNTGIFGKVWGYFAKPPQANIRLEDKVFFKDVVDGKLCQASGALKKLFGNSVIQDEEYVVERLKYMIKLKADIDIIVSILEMQHRIVKVQIETSQRLYRVIIYAGEGKEITTQTIQLEKSRYGLKVKLSEVNHKIEELYLDIQSLTSKARECMQRGDKSLAMNFVKDKVVQEKFLAGIIDRRRILNNTLNQLDESVMNQSVIETIKTSQDLIKSNIVDPDLLSEIKMNADQIKFNLEEAEKVHKEIAGDNAEEEELFRQLEKETLEEKEEELRTGLRVPPNAGYTQNTNQPPYQSREKGRRMQLE